MPFPISFVKTNEKHLNCCQNFAIEPVSALSNIPDGLITVSNDDKDGSLDRVNLVKPCISTIASLTHDISRKRKNKSTCIVFTDCLALCLPKPETNPVKTKLKPPPPPPPQNQFPSLVKTLSRLLRMLKENSS